jgi:hypothetical protein
MTLKTKGLEHLPSSIEGQEIHLQRWHFVHKTEALSRIPKSTKDVYTLQWFKGQCKKLAHKHAQLAPCAIKNI